MNGVSRNVASTQRARWETKQPAREQKSSLRAIATLLILSRGTVGKYVKLKVLLQDHSASRNGTRPRPGPQSKLRPNNQGDYLVPKPIRERQG